MVKKQKIKSVLQLVFLALIAGLALIFTGCTKTESVSMIAAEGETTIKVKVVTADGSSVRVEGAVPAEIKGDAAEQTLTLTSPDRCIKIIKKSGDITKLYCSKNQRTSLNMQGLSALTWLSCYGNQLTALNVQGLSALKKLDCGRNQLTALNVQGLLALTWLSCDGNQLTSLNVQGCSALTDLYCYNNKLNAEALKEIFSALPNKNPNNKAMCVPYSEGEEEKNHRDFTSPPDLKAAFKHALNTKGWSISKQNANGDYEEI